jgi:glutamate-1-semialdehyde 2,1-aminomutase
MILGLGDPEVQEAKFQQIPNGMTFFASNTAIIALAEENVRAVPCADQVRYVTSSGEPGMYATRAARGYTVCDKILKFEGGYHDMSAVAQMCLLPDHLVNFSQAVPDNASIPDAVRAEILIAPFNDAEFLRSVLAEHGTDCRADCRAAATHPPVRPSVFLSCCAP